jgi:hypothetical protein
MVGAVSTAIVSRLILTAALDPERDRDNRTRNTAIGIIRGVL